MQAADFIAFDVETATAEPCSLCQIGFVGIPGRCYSTAVSPCYYIKVVFTGVLDGISREEAARMVKAKGAEFNACGAGINIIGEREFLDMINEI